MAAGIWNGTRREGEATGGAIVMTAGSGREKLSRRSSSQRLMGTRSDDKIQL